MCVASDLKGEKGWFLNPNSMAYSDLMCPHAKSERRPSADHGNSLLHLLVVSLMVRKNKNMGISDALDKWPSYLTGFL